MRSNRNANHPGPENHHIGLHPANLPDVKIESTLGGFVRMPPMGAVDGTAPRRRVGRPTRRGYWRCVFALQQSEKAREILFDLLPDWAPDEKLRHVALVDNPAELHGLPKS